MSYSFVWLYLLKCVFTCSIFVDSNTKRFLSVLGVFGKYFIFTKTKKFQKQCCHVLATQLQVIQVTCYSRELACWFWRLVHEWKVQLQGVHRDFRCSARDSFTGRPSNCEKHLENFSQFCLWVFWWLTLATCWRLTPVAKYACLAKTGSVFKLFSVFPQTFYDYSLSLSTDSHRNTPCHSLQTPLLHLFTSKPSRKKKGMGAYSLISYLVFWASFLWVFVLGFWFFVMSLFRCFWDCSCLDY